MPPLSFRTRAYSVYRTTHVGPRKGIATALAHEGRYKEWDKLLGPFLPLSKSSAILDVGCGSGAIVQWLLARGFTNAVGVDASDEEFRAAVRLNLPVTHGDGYDMLIRNPDRYSLIILRNILEHISKDEILSLLDAVKTSLLPGGQVWIQVPNAEAPFGSRVRYADFTHEIAFTQVSIAQILRLAGFDRLHIGAVNPFQPGIFRAIRWWITKQIYLFCLSSELGHSRFILTQDLFAVARKAD